MIVHSLSHTEKKMSMKLKSFNINFASQLLATALISVALTACGSGSEQSPLSNNGLNAAAPMSEAAQSDELVLNQVDQLLDAEIRSQSTKAVASTRKTYYVDETNGRETNDGLSAANPFRLLSTAAGKAMPGDTVKLLPGTYRNFGASDANNGLYVPRSGTQGNYITYAGVKDAQGRRPVIESSALSAFTMQGRSFIVIEDLEFKASTEDHLNLKTSVGSWAWNQRAGVRIQDDSHNIIVRRNLIYDFPSSSVAVSSSDAIVVNNNIVEHNAWGSSYGTSGISFYKMRDQPKAVRYSSYPKHDVIIANNISRYNVQLLGSQAFDWKLTDGNGIIIDDFKDTQTTSNAQPYSGSSLIIGNQVYGNGGAGINVFQTNNADVLNNSVFDNGQSLRPASKPSNLVFNMAHQPIQVGGSANTLVANNIFVRTDTETSMVSTFWNDDATIKIRNNLFWNTVGEVGSVPSNNVVAAPNWTRAVGLTQAQSNLLATITDIYNPGGASAKVSRPTLNNSFPIQNLRLLAASRAIDVGVDYGYRNYSGSAPDLGALEYVAP